MNNKAAALRASPHPPRPTQRHRRISPSKPAYPDSLPWDSLPHPQRLLRAHPRPRPAARPGDRRPPQFRRPKRPGPWWLFHKPPARLTPRSSRESFSFGSSFQDWLHKKQRHLNAKVPVRKVNLVLLFSGGFPRGKLTQLALVTAKFGFHLARPQKVKTSAMMSVATLRTFC